MKRTVYMTLAAVALALIALVPAYAQKTSATVNIRFAFTVDDVLMPAGEYLIYAPSEKVVSIQRVGGSEAKVTVTTSGSATADRMWWNSRCSQRSSYHPNLTPKPGAIRALFLKCQVCRTMSS
jgi:hypothetical protein